ncbi:MAG: endolytic transglycosylase MltG [Patescibacteria group bacterium]
MKTFLISIFVVGVIFIGISINFFIIELQPALKSDKNPIIINIAKGAGFSEITDELYAAGLIRSKIVFKIYTLLNASAHRLQNGRYKFNSPVSIPELVNILKIGPRDVSVLIFPGMTFKEIDDKLLQENIIKAGDLINYGNFEELKNHYDFLSEAISLEGFLLPDTYNFRQDSDIDSVIGKFLDNFKNKAMAIINGDLAESDGFRNIWQIGFVLAKSQSLNGGVDKKNSGVLRFITIASYLEKEVPNNDDRRIVAGIIEKRLKIGMPIQIDATILYNKCFGRFSGCPLLVKSDFKKDSPYNTYTRLGLTPTPIANPSLDAIKAAIEKKDSGYWFYLSDPKTKKTIFSENLEKHNINRAKYLLNNE